MAPANQFKMTSVANNYRIKGRATERSVVLHLAVGLSLLAATLASTVSGQRALSEVWSEGDGLRMKYSTNHEDLLSTHGSELSLSSDQRQQDAAGAAGSSGGVAAAAASEEQASSEGPSPPSSSSSSSGSGSDESSSSLATAPSSPDDEQQQQAQPEGGALADSATPSSGSSDEDEPSETTAAAASSGGARQAPTKGVGARAGHVTSYNSAHAPSSSGQGRDPATESNSSGSGDDDDDSTGGSSAGPPGGYSASVNSKFRQPSRAFKSAIRMTTASDSEEDELRQQPSGLARQAPASKTTQESNEGLNLGGTGAAASAGEEMSNFVSSSGGADDDDSAESERATTGGQSKHRVGDSASGDNFNGGANGGDEQEGTLTRAATDDEFNAASQPRGRQAQAHRNMIDFDRQRGFKTLDESSQAQAPEMPTGGGGGGDSFDSFGRASFFDRAGENAKSHTDSASSLDEDTADFGVGSGGHQSRHSAAPRQKQSAGGHHQNPPRFAPATPLKSSGAPAGQSYKQLAYFKNVHNSAHQQQAFRRSPPSTRFATSPASASEDRPPVGETAAGVSPDNVRDNFISPGHYPGSMPYLTQAASDATKTLVAPTSGALAELQVAGVEVKPATEQTESSQHQQQVATEAAAAAAAAEASVVGSQVIVASDTNVALPAIMLAAVTPQPASEPESQQIMAPTQVVSTTTMPPPSTGHPTTATGVATTTTTTTTTTTSKAPSLKRFKLRKYR